jgi:hypothetical protein
MSWKFWRRQPTTPKENPSLHIEVAPDGEVQALAVFPRTDQPLAATSFASMLYLMHTGRLLPLLQMAVSKGAVLSEAEDFAAIVLDKLNRLVAHHQGQLESSDGPVVKPTELFGMSRNEENPHD